MLALTVSPDRNRGATAMEGEAHYVLDADGSLVKSIGSESVAEFETVTSESTRIGVGLAIVIPEGTRLYTVYRVIAAALAEQGFNLRRTLIREGCVGDDT